MLFRVMDGIFANFDTGCRSEAIGYRYFDL